MRFFYYIRSGAGAFFDKAGLQEDIQCRADRLSAAGVFFSQRVFRRESQTSLRPHFLEL